MKKILSALAIGLAISNTAMAADGTINFTGLIITNTCTISINNGTGAQTGAIGTVNLPIVTKSQFSGVGDTSQGKAFTIALTGCDSLLNGKTVAFQNFTGANINANGRLNNTGTATNTQIALYSGSSAAGTLINLSTASNTPTQPVAGAAATFPLYAAYYPTVAPASLTAGTVTSTVDFSLTYF